MGFLADVSDQDGVAVVAVPRRYCRELGDGVAGELFGGRALGAQLCAVVDPCGWWCAEDRGGEVGPAFEVGDRGRLVVESLPWGGDQGFVVDVDLGEPVAQAGVGR